MNWFISCILVLENLGNVSAMSYATIPPTKIGSAKHGRSRGSQTHTTTCVP